MVSDSNEERKRKTPDATRAKAANDTRKGISTSTMLLWKLLCLRNLLFLAIVHLWYRDSCLALAVTSKY